ncbi:hypothetical protein EGI32_19685 [Ferruginibacter sp. HRS2-29]|nr:hypothetical protein [Ferruginibacter sp. HRS2-29]
MRRKRPGNGKKKTCTPAWRPRQPVPREFRLCVKNTPSLKFSTRLRIKNKPYRPGVVSLPAGSAGVSALCKKYAVAQVFHTAAYQK